MPRRIKRFGWVRDLPDQRDSLYGAPIAVTRALPRSVDLRPKCPPVYNQGQLGSCTANAIAAAIQFDREKQQLTPDFVPSRLFIYYNERAIEGTVREDTGAQIRDGIKTVAHQGDCPERLWPYRVGRFAEKPPVAAYKAALEHRAVSYQRLGQDLWQMKGCLASGYPFVFGFTVYDGFESEAVAKSGHLAMPEPSEQVLGGHAVIAVGYNDARQWFIVRNSWGADWGLDGYFTIPYAYLSQATLAADFWTIRIVE